jgi:hypothetical protein
VVQLNYREDLVIELQDTKKKLRAIEESYAYSKAENQRLESEASKQQRRIDQLLNLSEGAKNIGISSEIRRDIEKSILVRQLKNQINNLRNDYAEKEAELETIKRVLKATYVSEVEYERDEYFLEVQRLKGALLEVKDDLNREKQRREWNNRVAGDMSDDLRREVARLATGYNNILTNITNRAASGTDGVNRPATSTGMRASNNGEVPLHSNRPSSATATGSASAGSTDRPKRPSSATSSKPTALSSYYNQPATDGAIPAATASSAMVSPMFSDPLDNFGLPGSRGSGGGGGDVAAAVALIANTAAATPTATVTKANDSGMYKVGDRVEGLFGSGSNWYSGVVRAYRHGGNGVEGDTYHISYDDGDEEYDVPLHKIRFPVSEDARGVPQGSFGGAAFSTAVPAALAPSPASHPALMGGGGAAAAPVPYFMNNAPGSFGNPVNDTTSAAGSGGISGSPSKLSQQGKVAAPSIESSEYKVGDKIEALYYSGTTWYKGKVQAVHVAPPGIAGEFVYDISYDDGDRELKVPVASIRKIEAASSEVTSTAKSAVPTTAPAVDVPAVHAKFKVGDKVEGLYGGGSSWYPATVLKVHAPKSSSNSECVKYLLQYNDGDREDNVWEVSVRSAVAATTVAVGSPRLSSNPATISEELVYAAGERVQGYFEDFASWYDGTVDKRNSDGTYLVRYDDGDVGEQVPAASLRKLPPASPRPAVPSAFAKYSVGDRVEGNFGKSGAWYLATVSAVTLSASLQHSHVYALQYDDGDYESEVVDTDMRRAPGASTVAGGVAPAAAAAPSSSSSLPTATDVHVSPPRKTSLVDTNLDSFLNELSDDDDDVGIGGLDSGRGVTLKSGAGPSAPATASAENEGNEEDAYDEDFDA